ncbi:transposase [Ureibacillus acetophenoni]|uniref:REP element-mobilizing transposase RayT n=1 Tax=Ureibacillus acetophenoni TaxID=614649 RepID=A0A285TYY3_9BACL|nr:transposase [Ureibacillus acetophenoni]SOC34920.1 REP element-mobilizing transposase RayT [Ureibacillus acetophenoni]
MPRGIRIWNPNYFHHIVMRGNNRQRIFQNERDFNEFFRVLYYTYDKYPFTIAAYCIMSNHYHLLLKSPEYPLGHVMRSINRRYCDYFKKKYKYTGHLYESRYFSKMITTPMSLLSVSRYIHRNPINTETPIVVKLEHYPYSSYALNKNPLSQPLPFIDTTSLLSCLKYPNLQTKEDYFAYCENNIDDNDNNLLAY